jgi:hypothetical protein
MVIVENIPVDFPPYDGPLTFEDIPDEGRAVFVKWAEETTPTLEEYIDLFFKDS